MRRIPILIVMGATSILASAGRLQAQFGPGGPYSPGGVTSPYPILSPWLNLEQKQGGPVDNYHMYVQPQLQLQSTLQAQQYNIARNSATVDALGDSVTAQQAYDTPGVPRVRWPASTPTESISTRSAEGILLEWVAPPPAANSSGLAVRRPQVRVRGCPQCLIIIIIIIAGCPRCLILMPQPGQRAACLQRAEWAFTDLASQDRRIYCDATTMHTAPPGSSGLVKVIDGYGGQRRCRARPHPVHPGW